MAVLYCSLYNAQKINIKSPQSYEMERYGNIPVNMNVGGVDMNIPLFQAPIGASDKSFTMNLSYNSSGFIPTKRSNYVGLNWMLDVGGMITREVNHLPDDEPQFAVENNREINGLLVGIRNTNISKTTLFDNNTDVDDFGNFKSGGSTGFELGPDKFSFNFMGISGYFYIDAEKNPVFSSNDPNLKIDITGFQNQKSPKIGCHDFNSSEIVITDGKGNKYYFGGPEENIEVNYPLGTSRDSPGSSVNGQNYYINAWYLSKVEFAEGSNMTISYLKFQDVGSIGVSDGFCQNSFFPPTYRLPGSEVFFEQHSYVNASSTAYVSVINDGFFSGVNSNSSNPALSYHFNLLKKVYPSKVMINGKKVAEFTYKQNEGSSFTNPALGNVFNKYYKSFSLENVFLYNGVNDVLVKKIGFTYYRNNEYFFLDEVTLNDLKYKFDYYDKFASLAHETTTSVDHWGYWNNKAEFSNPLIPDYKINPNTGEYIITGTSREPSTTSVQRTLLSRVTYPTGGYSEFIYEPHDYSKKLDRTPNSNFFEELKTQNGTVGGARIAKVLDFDGTKTIETEYKYKNNYPTGTTSSGISNRVIRYSNFVKSGNNTQYAMVQKSVSNNIIPGSMSGSPINYSEVSVLKNGLLQKKYLFSDQVTNPDTLVYRNRASFGITDLLPDNIVNMKRKYQDRSSLRGKIIRELDFNESGATIVSKEYKYSDNKKLPVNKYNLFYVETGEAEVLYYKDFLFPNNLTKTTTTNFFNTQSVNTVNEYFYDHTYDNNISRERVSSSSTGTSEASYQYAKELYGTSNDYVTQNIVGVPLVTTRFNNNLPVSKTKLSFNRYWFGYDKLLPSQQESVPIQLINTPNEVYDKEVTYDHYDTKGNLVQYTTKAGVPVTIIYGYNQALPILKVEGVSYLSFMDLLGMDDNAVNYYNLEICKKSDLDIDRNTEDVLINALDNIRQNPFLKGTQITTYTHDPLVGVTTITPPSGIRERYFYDTANRLEKIVDVNNKVVKEFKYKHKN